MTELLPYLIKVAVAIGLLVLPYYFVIRSDANLLLKRLYLVGGILLSWVFPLLTIRKPAIVGSGMPEFFIDPAIVSGTTLPGTPASVAAVPEAFQSGTSIDFALILAVLYVAGILFFIGLNLYSFIKIRKNSMAASSESPNVVRTKSPKVFTVFKKIFLPEKYHSQEEIDTIMIHEQAHIRQLHFIDLLISETSLLLTWFNPFSWLISRMIKENHEHLADREVLSRGIKPAHYKALLLNHALGGEVFRLGHQFNHSLTKKRFNMMKKMKATKRGIVKYMFFVPAILFFTLMLTAAGQNKRTIKGKVYLESTEVPAHGASVVVKGSTTGTVVNKQGEFTLDITGNPTIVFSYVGYETQQIEANKINRKGIILIPKAAEIPLSRLKKKETTVAEKPKTTAPAVVGNAQKSDVQIEEEEVFYVVEDVPMFPEGLSALGTYIQENLEYPAEAKKKNMEGLAKVEFVVQADGSIDRIRIAESSNDIFNQAAMDVFKDMPDWKPGSQRGKKVPCKVIVPVEFKLTEE